MVNKTYQHFFEKNLSIEDFINSPEWREAITSEVFVYQLLNKTGFNDFDSLPQEILSKPAIILSSLEKFYLTKKDIPGNLSQDISFCMYCCNLDPKYALLFSKLIESNESLASWYIQEFKNVVISNFLPEKYFSEKPYGIALIKNNIGNYPHLSKELKNDISIYNSLNINQKLKAYKHAGENISSNWNFSVEITSIEPSYYQYISTKLQKNPNFYIEALGKLSNKSSVSELLMHSHVTIKDNEHCVWQSLLLEPKSLSQASRRLLNSTSFAQQVISSMSVEQVSESFQYWELHVTNSGVTLEDLLNKIIQANCLSLIGPELKENQGFMLKAILIDSKQTLESCAPNLLSDAHFIINAYHAIDEKNLHKDRYDEHGEQSEVFNYIPEKSTENIEFITQLYIEFKDIFISIVYPKIKEYDNPLIHYLNLCNQKKDGIMDALEKMLLQNELQKELANDHKPKKKPKI